MPNYKEEFNILINYEKINIINYLELNILLNFSKINKILNEKKTNIQNEFLIMNKNFNTKLIEMT